MNSFQKLSLCLFVATGSIATASQVPLFAEDASARVGRWYFSEVNVHFRDSKRWAEIQKIAKTHDFDLVPVPLSYEWIQDITLFDEQGSFVAQADYSLWDFETMQGLTRGVANEDGGLLRISESEAQSFLGIASSRMRTSFVEGGGLVTGRNRQGQPYALVTAGAMKRARAFVVSQGRPDPGDAGARQLVADDLRVEPKRLYVLQSGGHLDLTLLALPNGKILLDDPSLVAKTLKTLRSEASETEAGKIDRMIRLYEEGHVSYYADNAHGDLAGKPMGPARFPFQPYELKNLDAIEEVLEKDFEVIRVAGVFKDSPEGSWGFSDRINFFNGFQGRDKNDVHWVVTNEAAGLEVLERYWSRVLREHSEASELKVYFPGTYSSGAGIDCSGAPAP